MFTTLGIDWGEKRFGMAFGDPKTELVITANYHCLTKNIFAILAQEIEQRKIQTIVVGVPTNFHGDNTLITDKINQFITQLRFIYPTLEMISINERSSTKDAKNILENNHDKHTLNHQAAAKILEYYFYSRGKR